MQTSRILRAVRASPALRDAGNPYVAKAPDHLIKHWKSFTYTRNQRIQQLSPFEVDILGPLFRNIGEKFKHKFEDNFWDVAPPVIFFISLVYFVKWKRSDMLYHHRD